MEERPGGKNSGARGISRTGKFIGILVSFEGDDLDRKESFVHIISLVTGEGGRGD